MKSCQNCSPARLGTLVLGLLLVSPLGLRAQTQETGPDGRPLGQSLMPVARILNQPSDVQSADVWRGGDGDLPGAYVHSGVEAALTSRSFVADGMRALAIGAEAPVNSFMISDKGWVGLGTETPKGRLHVAAPFGDSGSSDLLLLDDYGNLEIGGVLSEASSVHLKDRIQSVDGDEVLERLLGLRVQTWNYTSEASDVRHMGLMAQDFSAAFGLGASAEAIAVLDVSGVTLAGLQALAGRVEAQLGVIEELKEQNALLMRRLEALESR